MLTAERHREIAGIDMVTLNHDIASAVDIEARRRTGAFVAATVKIPAVARIELVPRCFQWLEDKLEERIDDYRSGICAIVAVG